MKIVAWLILGNGADELVADWSFSSKKASDDFEIANDAFMKVWEGKKVPTLELPEWQEVRRTPEDDDEEEKMLAENRDRGDGS